MKVAKFEAQDFKEAVSFPSKRLSASLHSDTDTLVVTDGKGWYWMAQGIVLKDIEGFEVERERLKKIGKGKREVEVEIKDDSVYFIVEGAKIKVGEVKSWHKVEMPELPKEWHRISLPLLKRVASIVGKDEEGRIIISGDSLWGINSYSVIRAILEEPVPFTVVFPGSVASFILKAKGEDIYAGVGKQKQGALRTEYGSFVTSPLEELTTEQLRALTRLRDVDPSNGAVIGCTEFEELKVFLTTVESVIGKEAPIEVSAFEGKLRLCAKGRDGAEAYLEVPLKGSAEFHNTGLVNNLRSRIEGLKPPIYIFSFLWDVEQGTDVLVLSDQDVTVFYAVKREAAEATYK